MGETQGGRGGLNEGAGVLGVRATGRAGEISGETGGVRCAAEKEGGEDGADKRAPLVSGVARGAG